MKSKTAHDINSSIRGNGFLRLPHVTVSGKSCVRSAHEISASNFFLQPNDWSCGLAVFRMACLTFGYSPGSFQENMMLLGTRSFIGTAQVNLVKGLVSSLKERCHITMGHSRTVPLSNNLASGHGYGSPEENRRVLEGLLQKQNLVIVNYREPEDQAGHYAIVQALSPDEIELADPWHGHKSVLPLSQFDWRNGSPEPASTIHGWYVALRAR